MSPIEEKNSIVLEMKQLDQNHRQIRGFVYFMDILEAEFIANRILTGRFPINQKYEHTKGIGGKARTISIMKRENDNNDRSIYYQIKIDNGIGTPKENGFTSFEVKEGHLYMQVSETEIEKAMISIQKRIRLRELLFEITIKREI